MGDVQLSLPCASMDVITGQCVSYLPAWVFNSKGGVGEWLPPSSVGVPLGRVGRLVHKGARARAPHAPPSPPAWGWGSSISNAWGGGRASNTGRPARQGSASEQEQHAPDPLCTRGG